METFWFCAVAVLVAMYVVFDGFDLGAGFAHLFIARDEKEREQVLESIGPFWDGNEVWLLAGGGTLYFAFPALYASSFSGFYLPLMIVLWLLMLRGIAIEFHHQIDHPAWRRFWDTTFGASSLALTVFFGAALGNVVRGVPLDASGRFFLPLWTDFRIGSQLGILDWYTVLVGVASFAVLSLHGTLWVAIRTAGELGRRAGAAVSALWWVVFALTTVLTAVSFSIQPLLWAQFGTRFWGFVFPALAVGSLVAIRVFDRRRAGGLAFLASCLFIVGMLTSVVFGVYPNVLPAVDAQNSLTVENAAAAQSGLRVGLWWFTPAFVLVIGYFSFTYSRLWGKVEAAG